MSYVKQLPKEFVVNFANLEWGAGQVRMAWYMLKELLAEVITESAIMEEMRELLSRVYEEMERYERCEGRFIGLVPYVVLVKPSEGDDDELIPNLAMVIRVDQADIMVVSMASTAHQPALAHVILHELVHSAGFISEEERIDEKITDYIVNEVIKHSNDKISDEAELRYTPKCIKGCGILGAAAQYLIDKGRYVLEEEFDKHIEEYLDRGIIVHL